MPPRKSKAAKKPSAAQRAWRPGDSLYDPEGSGEVTPAADAPSPVGSSTCQSDANTINVAPRTGGGSATPPSARDAATGRADAAAEFPAATTWFAARNWKPFAFQLEAWRAFAAGRSGLIHAPTGTGKTLAAWMGFIESACAAQEEIEANTPTPSGPPQLRGPRALWITPMRALANDTTRSLQAAVDGVGLPWRVELRTGDTTSTAKRKQRFDAPEVLVTTPESLSVMLSYPEAPRWLNQLELVIIDEWHELLGNKRGVQTELGLARLRAWNSALRTWGVSATLGNLREAMAVLMGVGAGEGLLIRGDSTKHYELATLLPEKIENFPWAGHLGLRQLPGVIAAIERARSTLVFTNTRGQAEIWHQALLKARPEWLRLGSLVEATGSDAHAAANPDEDSNQDQADLDGAKTSSRKKPKPKRIGRHTPLPMSLSRAVRNEQVRAQRGSGWRDAPVETSAPGDTAQNSADPYGLTTPTGDVFPLAIHHGSLDRDLRQRIEALLKQGRLRAVVCTSSLDLGVDFPPVDQVIQIGSPKGVGRLMQRAGRSGHQPGRTSRVLCVPTNALELVEFAAAQDAMTLGEIESREPVVLALDLLCQHILTVAVGGGFVEEDLYREVRRAHAFKDLTREQWGWALDFAVRGGPSLRAYERFARLRKVSATDAQQAKSQTLDALAGLHDTDASAAAAHDFDDDQSHHHHLPAVERYEIASDALGKLHRLGIGTIVSDSSVEIRLSSGAFLGSVEEGFVSRMVAGDVFTFAGRRLELLSLRDMTATVRPARTNSGTIVSWQGSRMALSSQLAAEMRKRFEEAQRGVFRGPEMERIAPLLKTQTEWSALPTPGTLVIEHVNTREGHHAFVYTLEGRLVHEGLAALAAYRLSRTTPRTLNIAASDYGFELQSPTPLDLTLADWRTLLSTTDLAEDLLRCINASELAKRQFREIARIAGLLVPIPPGMNRVRGQRVGGAKHMQASSGLYYEVFEQFDPGNLLLNQARREVLSRQLEYTRLKAALERVERNQIVIKTPGRLTPLAFPLWADNLREQLTSEQWEDRVQRMLTKLEEAAAGRKKFESEEAEIVDVARPMGLRGSKEQLRAKASRWRRPRI
ncbi:hypothetical protein BH11PLA1_BH11PLA1_11080 [soil metagenome]